MKIGSSTCTCLKRIITNHLIVWLFLLNNILTSNSAELSNENTTKGVNLCNPIKEKKESRLRNMYVSCFGRYSSYGKNLIRDTGKIITSDGECKNIKNSKCPITLHDDKNFDEDILKNVMDTSEMFEQDYHISKKRKLLKNNVYILNQAMFVEYIVNNDKESSKDRDSPVYEYRGNSNADLSKKHRKKSKKKENTKEDSKPIEIEEEKEEEGREEELTKEEESPKEEEFSKEKESAEEEVTKEASYMGHAKIMKRGGSIIIVGQENLSPVCEEIIPLSVNELSSLCIMLMKIYRAVHFEHQFFRINMEEKIRDTLHLINTYERKVSLCCQKRTDEKMIKKFLQSISFYKEHFSKLSDCSNNICILDSFEIFGLLISAYDVFFNANLCRFLRYLNQRIYRRRKSLDSKITSCINTPVMSIEALIKNVSSLLFREKQKVINLEVFILRNILMIPETDKEKKINYTEIINNLDCNITNMQSDMRRLLDIWVSSEYVEDSKLTEMMNSNDYPKFIKGITECLTDIDILKNKIKNDIMNEIKPEISLFFILYFVIAKEFLRYIICVPMTDAFISIDLHYMMDFLEFEKFDKEIKEFISKEESNKAQQDLLEKYDNIFFLLMIYTQLQLRRCLLLHLMKLVKQAMALFSNYANFRKEKKKPVLNGRLVEISYKMTDCFSTLYTMLMAFKEKSKVINAILEITNVMKDINETVNVVIEELETYDVMSISKEDILVKFYSRFKEIHQKHTVLFSCCTNSLKERIVDFEDS